MKFRNVFLLLFALLAISFALPSNVEENEEHSASNGEADEEKRLFGFVARKGLGYAIKAVCKYGRLPANIKGLCDDCLHLMGDEEAKVEEEKRGWFRRRRRRRRGWFSRRRRRSSGSVRSAVCKLKSAVKKVCNGFLIKHAIKKLQMC
ncbi:uncharacterized protein LOC114542146 [Dendronephthya gigantea]|uniref:uncharacterized protein LOC114542146 n=1 Tax=Dendronephthya gigantea TaxID=151771 RepID=UPI00106BF009|nr:uncharacterized protein LOC114542146 [Dendronephthya gigantea]